MIYAVYGFVFGLLIPYISRRFAKFMPATMAYALVSLCKFSKKVTSEKWEKSLTYTKLRREFFYRSLLCGIVTAAVSYFAYAHFGSRGLWWQLYFIWSLLLLAEIDYRMFLLPDILTVPLLILGFAASCWGWGHISGAESALGAVGGYFLPVLVSLLFVWKNKDAFGGGDIKLLAALGAWLGFEKLLYVIVVSAVLFIFYAAIKRQRSGAYGPAIAIAGIIVAFYFF